MTTKISICRSLAGIIFTILLLAEISMGSETILSVKTAPSGSDKTTLSEDWLLIPDMSSTIILENKSNLKITFSGEVDTTNGKRMFVRALVDGQPANPSDVIFVTEGFAGVRSFTFVKENIEPGNHDVQIQWCIDAGGTGRIGDRSLTILSSPDLTNYGGLAIKAAPSGPDKTITTESWEDIPDMIIYTAASANNNFDITLSAEVDTTNGKRMFVRALVDGLVADPSDVVYVAEGFTGVRSFSFMKENLAAGVHTIQMQWSVDSGGAANIGDRTLSVSNLPSTSEKTKNGGLVVKTAPSGPDKTITTESWENIPDMSTTINAPVSNTNIDMALSAESGVSDGKRMFVRALVDGQIANPSDVLFVAEGFDGVRSITFTKENLAAGSHSIQMQWAVDSGGTGYIGDRSLSIDFWGIPEDNDKDGIPNEIDNCPNKYNPGQEDIDANKVGDACDCNDVFKGPYETGVDCGGECAACMSIPNGWKNLDAIRLRGPPNSGFIDMVFIPNTDYSNDLPRYKNDTIDLIRNYLFKLDKLTYAPIPSNYRDRFNLYFYTGGYGFRTDVWNLPANFRKDVPGADVAEILKNGNCCVGETWGLGSPSWLHTPARDGITFIHENGHGVWGLIDEYCGDTAYSQNKPVTNVWSSLSGCQNDANSQGWKNGNCRQITWDNLSTPQNPDCSKNFWKYDNISDIMDDGGKFNEACGWRMNWAFENWPIGSTKGILINFNIKNNKITELESEIVDGHPDIGLQYESFSAKAVDSAGEVLKSFGVWDPRITLGEEMISNDNVNFTIIFPFYDNLKTFEMRNATTDERLITVDLTETLQNYCNKYNYEYPECKALDLDNNGIKDFKKGDIDGDGEVTTSDALIFLKYSIGDKIPFQVSDIDDVTCDGKVDIDDALGALKKAVDKNFNFDSFCVKIKLEGLWT